MNRRNQQEIRLGVRRGHVPPTTLRNFTDMVGHAPPTDRVDDDGNVWKGASRILDRSAKRRANRKSWIKIQADARRSAALSKMLGS
jgi:hypothetical protein